jgi:hypothetical protein
MKMCRPSIAAGMMMAVVGAGGCGTRFLEDPTLYLNPSFVNYSVGGVVPLAPGSASGFVLVRTVNNTALPIEFVVTVESLGMVTTNGVADVVTQSYRLQTFAGGLVNDISLLVNCPVLRVGLGEDLDFPFDVPGLFVGTVNQQVITGFGVPGNVNPLDSSAGNFSCGDTLIFEANPRAGAVGNLVVNSYVLSAAGQPATFSGPDTFNNARSLLELYSTTE